MNAQQQNLMYKNTEMTLRGRQTTNKSYKIIRTRTQEDSKTEILTGNEDNEEWLKERKNKKNKDQRCKTQHS